MKTVVNKVADKQNSAAGSASAGSQALMVAKEHPFQRMADRSPGVRQLMTLQKIASATTGAQTIVIQRKLSLGAGEADEELTTDEAMTQIIAQNKIKDVRRADAIEEIIKVYEAKNMHFDSIDDLLQQAEKELDGENSEEADEVQEAADIEETEPSAVTKAMTSKSGDQYTVQSKMAGITTLLRKQMLQGKDKEAARTKAFTEEVLINGLCGGWATLFLEHPDWVESVYNAVRTWVRPEGMEAAAALLHFEAHLQKVSRFKGAGQVIRLLSEAYERMSELEPDAQYDSRPQWTADLDTGEIPSTTDTTGASKEASVNIRLKGRNAAATVCAKIAQLTQADKAGECMAHIESDIHHMALRLQKQPKKQGKSQKLQTVVTVVESEKTGIVKLTNLGQAAAILDKWLSAAEPNLQTITLRTKTAGFT